MIPGQIPSGNTVRKQTYGPAPAGRPPGNGKYVVLPDPGIPAGFAMKTEPDVIKQVKDTYMKDVSDKQLPPVLQPKRFAPKQAVTNRNISKGWQKPKDGRNWPKG